MRALVLIAVLGACDSAPERAELGEEAERAEVAEEAERAEVAEARTQRAPTEPRDEDCPERMAKLPSGACMDRFEALIVDEAGRPTARAADHLMPANGPSFDDADEACRNAGFRLCTRDEWNEACRGSEGRAYPYGSEFDAARCNAPGNEDSFEGRAVAPSGTYERCVTPEGIYDLSGNLGEWIDATDVSGLLRELRGGSYVNYPRATQCETENLAYQPRDAAFTGQGFRCCVSL